MPNAFTATGSGSPRAVVAMRRNNDGTVQNLDQSIPDGDTIAVHIAGSAGVRFLGIDTPEKSFQQPRRGGATLNGEAWETYLTDPFAPTLTAYALDPDLIAHLKERIGPGKAANHHRHAEATGEALKSLVAADMNELGQDAETFGYFLAFSYEVFDSFARFLAFINRDQPDANDPAPRPLTYNERMLERGRALPYFIWPNINPFREAESVVDAVIPPGGANAVAETGAFKRARDFVRAPREARLGVFDAADPLAFEAFEIRYLGRRSAPSRAVIDLGKGDDTILRPQSYFKIPNPEDRLFNPAEFVSLFAARGWRLEGFE